MEKNNNLVSVVAAAAKVEQNETYNGSETARKMENIKYVSEKEPENWGKKENEVDALTFVSPNAYKFVFALDDSIVTQDRMLRMDPMLRITKGFFMLKYVPKTSHDYKKGRPWKLGQDIIRMGVRLSGIRHWHMICSKIPELDWIRRNSTMTDELFGICARHPGMTFFFTVDWVRYSNMLREKMKNDPTVLKQDTEHEYGAYKCSVERWRNVYKDKTATIRYYNDVLKDIQAVEKSQAVQEEMLAETGETGYTNDHRGYKGNNQPTDPKTGRFISRKKAQEQ